MPFELLVGAGPPQAGKIIGQPPGELVPQTQVEPPTPTTDRAVSAGDTTRPGQASIGRRSRTPEVLSL